MKYTVYINQTKVIEFGISITQCAILDLLCVSPTWADTEIVDNDVYYWVSRTKICEELEAFSLKPDTVQRHLKVLDEKNLINFIKVDKKDCIRLTKLGKSYYVGKKSEKEEDSEKNPKKLGEKSEKNSEKNPTYNNTNIINNTKDIKKEKNIKKEISKKSEKEKPFKFSLGKKTAYENLSQKYKHNLKAKILLHDGSINRYEKFILSLEANGYKYANFYSAYSNWNKEHMSKEIKHQQEPKLGEDWYKIKIDNQTTIAINSKTLEVRVGTVIKRSIEDDFSDFVGKHNQSIKENDIFENNTHRESLNTNNASKRDVNSLMTGKIKRF